MLLTVKAVYCRDFSDILTCQNPDFKSIVEKNWALTMDSIVSCIRGRGYESFLVLAFNRRKSIQNRKPPSFFWTRTTALHQADWEGRMAPPSNISWRCSRTSSRRGGAIHWNFSLKGYSSRSSITCSAVSVHPISFLSKEKISWYSMSKCSNFCASSGVQSTNWSSPPSCRNSSMSSFCLSSMESFFGADSGSCSSNFLVSSRVGFPSGIMLAANTQAITLPA